jgi:uncharacterized protein
VIDNLLIKPAGPDCNLQCEYCFYLDKEEIYPGKSRMELSTAESMISQVMEKGNPVTFSWQGGEPTLMGLDFYREIVELQKKHGSGGQSVSNTIQTNGLLLDQDWAKFLARYNFLVGLSLDGPRDRHDHHRKHPNGDGSYKDVEGTIQLLQDHGVQYNALTVLTSRNVKQPKRLVNFLLRQGVQHFQFIPAIETEQTEEGEEIARFTPSPEEVADFLDTVFGMWSESFPPSFSVRYFEALINAHLGRRPGICKLDEHCGSYLVVEHNGDVYPCDFYVEEEWKLGNLRETQLEEIADGNKFKKFARRKASTPKECNDCEFFKYCRGGCQRHRGLPGEPNRKTYLCETYRSFLARNLTGIEDTARQLR